MDIKPPASNAPNVTSSSTSTSTELPPSLQQLPRGTLLTAVVQSSSPLPGQAATPKILAQTPIGTTPSSSGRAETQTLNASQNRAFNVLLNINGNQIQTQSNSAFSVGQLLKIEVAANGGLRVVEIASKAPPIDQTLVQLQQGLRQALPLQQSPKLLLNNLVPLFQLLQQLPGNPANTQIRELLATIPELKQLANPATLKNSVNQSGLFLEAKIKSALAQIQKLLQNSQQQATQNKTGGSAAHSNTTGASSQNPSTQSLANRELATSIKQPLSQPGQPQPNALNSISGQPPPNPQTAARELIQNLLRDNPQIGRQLEQAIGQDFKSQLLKLSASLLPLLSRNEHAASAVKPAETALLQRILQVLPNINSSSLTSPASGSAASASLNNLPLSNLPINTQLLHLLTSSPATQPANAQQTGNSQSSRLDLAVSTVLRQIAASLAQVQANQLQSLVAPRADLDGGQILNNWSVEIPVLLEGQFKPIQLHINEERHSDTASQNNDQRRIWKITLGFDFDNLGEFFATLRIIDTSVSATFWSDKPETLQRISNELQYLNRSLSKLGLNVEELECRRGKPQIKETRLDQQLVDIKT